MCYVILFILKEYSESLCDSSTTTGNDMAFGILTLNANSTVFAWMFLILNSFQVGLCTEVFIRMYQMCYKIGAFTVRLGYIA